MISPRQLRMLQTLWGFLCQRSQLDPKDREARLQWVAGAIGRPIASFRELSADEANIALDAIQKQLPAELLKRKRPSRRLAHSYGTSGRRGGEALVVNLVDADTRALLDGLLARLGWKPEQFDAFLHSSKSPVRSGAIRTLAEANRAIWALKGMLRRRASSAAGEESMAKVS
ncbi:MAG TPA: hypothetical protein VKA02_04820 [Candidatus Acidoferrum sp.]|nr:hypothetical protein [Candidatus Acidoferrum sp.]